MEENITSDIKTRVFDMITVVFAIFAFIAMILFLLMINHTYRSVDGKQI